ncbi:hypothetical protein PAXRUDRAFT_26425 [Paxillus rubicundulus Ve08.2h10]|uniref:Uncharacterized protein n=1 Tax=Paxillus rubicundulus Ve08.2h10 TaxID=930991 RepID=A0A0D0E0C4_9AGAM|nr:hypothetical protein PAXRUDRAFT_26425 [Paxillus rubicundulus Ve08.2h10]
MPILNMSYDITCQWHKALWHQMQNFPPSLHLDYKSMEVTFLVPKFHLPTHISHCQWLFSFNLIRGIGHTDGEALECGWANINPIASSTKEMGLGLHHNTIDDHFGDWNWKKFIGLGEMILKKIQEAVPEQNDHLEFFEALTMSLKAKYLDLLSTWQHQVEVWEAESMKPNPFEVKTDCTLWHLKAENAKLGQHATDTQKVKLQQRSNTVMHQLEAWAKIQV